MNKGLSFLSTGALAALCLAISSVSADTIYSSLQDLAIPTNFDGVYLDIDTGATGGSSLTGWDINPFFGGVAIGNSPAFQPVRLGPGNLDRVLNLAAGTVVSGSLTYSSGFGGSGNSGQEHMGAGSDQFQVGNEGYLGFKFTTNAGSGPLYGWMRVTLTNNAAGAVIKDWAYDNAGGTLVIGRVQQSAAVSSSQTVTLSPAAGESFTLGSAITNTGGNINNLLKTGGGSVTLATASSYTGTTTVSAGTLVINGDQNSANGSVAVTGKLTGSGTVGGATTINPAGIQNAGDPTLNGAVGKQTFSNSLTYSTGSIFEWNLATVPSESGRGTSYDAVNAASLGSTTGAIFRIVLNGAQDFSEGFWDIDRTWSDIFKTSDGGSALSIASIFSGTVQYYNGGGGTLASIAAPAMEGAFTFNGSSLKWSAVPEPSSVLAGFLLATGLLRRRRA